MKRPLTDQHGTVLRQLALPAVILLSMVLKADPLSSKEFLTPKEIEKIQEAQEIEKRIKIYLEAASLRLKTCEDRLNGKEPVEGDPLEFYSVEEMLEGYYRIFTSVMHNLDEAAEKPGTDRSKLIKALKNLEESTEKASKDLAILKRMAEDGQREQVWNLVNRALEITKGARDGAEVGLSRFSEKPKPKGSGKTKG